LKFDTKVVRAGITPDPTTGSILPPIYETATYVLEEVGKDKGFDYTRSSNPTRQVLEANLAAIENAEYAISFASGMSAVDATFKLLSSGDHVICGDDVYGGVTRHLDNVLNRYGLSTTYVNSVDADAVSSAIKPATKMIWIETPTNPLLRITDLEAMVRIAKEHEILLAVDSTFATPVFLRPLEFGVDIVMHSTTKYLSGHNQIIGGVLATNRKDIFDEMKDLAGEYNMRFVGEKNMFRLLDTEIVFRIKDGKPDEVVHARIGEFCSLSIAKKMLNHSRFYGGFMPCRVIYVEYEDGRRYLVSMDMTLALYGGTDKKPINPELLEDMLAVKEAMEEIPRMAASGE